MKQHDSQSTGAADTCLQYHRIPVKRQPAPGGKRRWYRIHFEGGLGGHSGVDIDKGRCSAVVAAWAILAAVYNDYDFDVASISIGSDDATIASSADIIVCVPSGEAAEFVKAQQEGINAWIQEEYPADAAMHCTITKCEKLDTVIDTAALETLLTCLEQIPQGVVKMSGERADTVKTSNNVGRVSTETDHIFVSTLTRSLNAADLAQLSREIAEAFTSHGAASEIVAG